MPPASGKKSQSVPTSVTPLDSEPFEIPAIPKLPACPVCKTGLLYAIAADPEALHEVQPPTPLGDPKGHSHFIPSGGSITLHCFNCNTTQTQPLNADADLVENAILEAEYSRRQEAAASGVK